MNTRYKLVSKFKRFGNFAALVGRQVNRVFEMSDTFFLFKMNCMCTTMRIMAITPSWCDSLIVAR